MKCFFSDFFFFLNPVTGSFLFIKTWILLSVNSLTMIYICNSSNVLTKLHAESGKTTQYQHYEVKKHKRSDDQTDQVANIPPV